MQFTFTPHDTYCEVKEVTCSSSMVFKLPVAPDVVVEGLRTMLRNPDQRDHKIGTAYFDRLRDGLRVSQGSLAYTFKFTHLFPIVMDAD